MHLWCIWDLNLNMISPLLQSCWGFSFALGHGVSPQSCSSTYLLAGASLFLDLGYHLKVVPVPHSYSSNTTLTNMIIWTTAFSSSMKLWATPCRVTQDGSWWRVLTKCGPLEKGVANHFSILALRTPWTVWKGKKIGHWNRNSLGKLVSNMLLEKSREITPERMNRWSKSEDHTQLWMWLVMEIKFNAVKSNIAQEPGMLGPWIKANWSWEEWTVN